MFPGRNIWRSKLNLHILPYPVELMMPLEQNMPVLAGGMAQREVAVKHPDRLDNDQRLGPGQLVHGRLRLGPVLLNVRGGLGDQVVRPGLGGLRAVGIRRRRAERRHDGARQVAPVQPRVEEGQRARLGEGEVQVGDVFEHEADPALGVVDQQRVDGQALVLVGVAGERGEVAADDLRPRLEGGHVVDRGREVRLGLPERRQGPDAAAGDVGAVEQVDDGEVQVGGVELQSRPGGRGRRARAGAVRA